MKIGKVELCSYLLGDSDYPSRPYLLKNFKTNISDPRFNDKKRFDEPLNSTKIINEHAFGAFKIRWRILKNFNMNMDMATTVTFACCILHNFCEIYSKRVPLPEDIAERPNLFVGVRRSVMRLPDDSWIGKVAVEQMKAAIFES